MISIVDPLLWWHICNTTQKSKQTLYASTMILSLRKKLVQCVQHDILTASDPVMPNCTSGHCGLKPDVIMFTKPIIISQTTLDIQYLVGSDTNLKARKIAVIVMVKQMCPQVLWARIYFGRLPYGIISHQARRSHCGCNSVYCTTFQPKKTPPPPE